MSLTASATRSGVEAATQTRSSSSASSDTSCFDGSSDLDFSEDTSMSSSAESSDRAGVSTGKRSSAHTAPSSTASWILEKYTTQYVIPPAYAPAALQICITAFPLGLLCGLVLPKALNFILSQPNQAGGSLLSIFGTHFVDSETLAAPDWFSRPQLHIYLAAWTIFHLLEFTVTASYNPTRLFSDSFLLNNGIQYHVAHAVALIEFCITAYVKPPWKAPNVVTLVGLILIVFGQTLRSMAMIHASSNFSHIVADKKRTDHQLVTTGVYAWTRHPSYVGFFYWALGTQLLLGNVVGTLGFTVTLYQFFSKRIQAEERYLVEFFGEEYVEYRKRAGTGLPFIH